jgi:tetratricopeptide (TPR) repeat protein
MTGPADRLARMCEQLGGALPPESEPLAPLRDELAAVLRAGACDLAGKLRGELACWSSALDQFEQLSRCRLLRLPEPLAGLRDDLERARREAEQAVEALEAIGEGKREKPAHKEESPLIQAPAGGVALGARGRCREGEAPAEPCGRLPGGHAFPSSQTFGSAGASPSRSNRTPPPGACISTDPGRAPQAGEGKKRETAPQEDALAPFVPPPEEATPQRVRSLFAQADESRRNRDYDRAAALYDEVLRLEPSHRAARVRRGQIHLFCSRARLALEDFTSALDGDDADAGVFLLRGDACAVLGLLEEATADYSRCLALDGGNARARFNRAVAYRLQGQLSTARSEFTEILEAHPEQADAWYNRGLVHAAMGLLDQAASDLCEAVKWEHPEARTRLQAVRQEQKDRALAQKEKAEKPPEAAARKPSPAGACALPVGCPSCGAQGAVRWQKLHRLHACKRCSRSFRIDASGGMVEVIRTKDGRWVDRPEHERSSRRRLAVRVVALRLLPVAGLLLAVALLASRLSARARPPAEVELPGELKPRVEWFTRAWLKKEGRMMRRLVTPGEERNVYRWSVRHRPPAVERRAGEPHEDVPVEVTVLSSQGNTTTVKVRIPGAGGAGRPFEFLQQWAERGGRWVFVVPAR